MCWRKTAGRRCQYSRGGRDPHPGQAIIRETSRRSATRSATATRRCFAGRTRLSSSLPIRNRCSSAPFGDSRGERRAGESVSRFRPLRFQSGRRSQSRPLTLTVNPAQSSWSLQVNDALFPIGGYSHSYGLESYIDRGLVHDEKTAEAYIRARLINEIQYCELLTVRLACEAALRGDIDGMRRIDMLTEVAHAVGNPRGPPASRPRRIGNRAQPGAAGSGRYFRTLH